MATNLTANPTWVKRFGDYFDTLNPNQEGCVSIDGVMKWADNMEKLCKSTPDKIKAMRQSVQDFWGAVGLKAGAQLTKEQFLQGLNRLAQEEIKRKDENKPTLHEGINTALYDVVQPDNNDGTITLDEVKTLFKACEMKPSGAEAWFNAAEGAKDGKVQRKDLNEVGFIFFYHPEVQLFEI